MNDADSDEATLDRIQPHLFSLTLERIGGELRATHNRLVALQDVIASMEKSGLSPPQLMELQRLDHTTQILMDLESFIKGLASSVEGTDGPNKSCPFETLKLTELRERLLYGRQQSSENSNEITLL